MLTILLGILTLLWATGILSRIGDAFITCTLTTREEKQEHEDNNP